MAGKSRCERQTAASLPPAVKRRMVLSWEWEGGKRGEGGDMIPVACSWAGESQILFSSSLGRLGRPLTSVGPSG